MEEAGERDFAFEALELNPVGGKLEDALFVGLGIFGEPDFAGAGKIQLAGHAPLIASGDGVADMQAEFGPDSAGEGLALNGNGETITDTGHGEDGELVLVSDGFAKFGNGGGQGAVHDQGAGPDPFQ